MLIGEYITKIGDKKRIAIPKKIREALGDKLIITRGYENSLVLVDQNQFQSLTEQIATGSFINQNIRETTRFLVGSANEIETDSQGRVVIPTPLFEYAGMKSEVVFVGLINWVEVWDRERWEKKLEYLDKNSTKIAQELSTSFVVKKDK